MKNLLIHFYQTNDDFYGFLFCYHQVVISLPGPDYSLL